jgi:hypothetical protein
MKKNKKIILVICIVVFVVGAIFGAYHIAQHLEREAERAAEWRIARAYGRVYSAFRHSGQGAAYDSVFELWRMTEFQDMSGLLGNDFGINAGIYLLMIYYEQRTGNVLPYETVVDFFSEEFEPDGTRRLYDNGRHPEIQMFVEWMHEDWSRWIDVYDYENRIMLISVLYANANDANDIIPSPFHMSPQMLSALARAEADPDYVLDLTSLYEAGY